VSQSSVELFVYGRHVVLEALESNTTRVHQIWMAPSHEHNEKKILELTSPKNILTKKVHKEELTRQFKTDKHQNIGARVSLNTFASMKDWIQSAPEKKLFTALALDQIVDPQNVGSLLRSSHFFGIDVVIMTKDRAASITGAVAKASSGALFSVPIVRAVNLAREMEALQEHQFLILGLDPDSNQTLDTAELGKQNIAFVVGNEGEGLRSLTRKKCDLLVSLTKTKERESLNASVAGAIACYEMRKRQEV